MKNINVTNQVLYNYHIELQQLHKSVLGLLLRPKINEFYASNGLRINLLEQGILRIQKEHLVFDGEKIKYHEAKEGEQKQLVFIEGKTNDDLQKAYAELMEKEIALSI